MSKKLYILLVAALALTGQGCSGTMEEPRTEPEVPVEGQPVPVMFGMYEQPTTRANGTYYVDHKNVVTIPEGQKVGVFGYYQGEDTWNADKEPDFFYNEPMTSGGPLAADNSTAYLEYSPLRFWPNGENDMLAFYAYYPYSTFSEADKTAYGLTFNYALSGEHLTGVQGTFTFRCKKKASEQIDFMVAELEKNHKRTDHLTGDKRVGLTFYHKLARILISIHFGSNSNYNKVSSVKIEGVHLQATFHPAYMHERRAWEIPLIGDELREQGAVIIDKLPDSGDLNAKDSYSAETTLLLIPQRCELETHKIVVELADVNGETKEFYFALSDLWRAGRDYEYNFNVEDEQGEPVLTTDFHGNAGEPVNGGEINN